MVTVTGQNHNFYYSNNYDFVPLPLPSHYRPVTVPLPSRYRFWVLLNTVTSSLPYRYLTVTDRYWPLLTLPTVTHRYPPLLIVTDRYSPLPLLTVFLEI